MSTRPVDAGADSERPVHPWQNSNNLLVVIRDDKIDVEEESRLYDELRDDPRTIRARRRASSPPAPPSIFSNDIWLGDNSGESLAFSRDVHIGGWTSVGDDKGGAYIVYDCVIKTKEDTTIHTHKRYSAFVELHDALKKTLPSDLAKAIPILPPRHPLARFRPAFLDARRRGLQYWLAAVLLHPEIGGAAVCRAWVTS